MMPQPAVIQEAHFTRNAEDFAHKDPMLSVLRAYCLGLLKACWYVNERIKFEHYYEVSQLGSMSAGHVHWLIHEAGGRLCH